MRWVDEKQKYIKAEERSKEYLKPERVTRDLPDDFGRFNAGGTAGWQECSEQCGNQ
jgi:hypothetical protein